MTASRKARPLSTLCTIAVSTAAHTIPESSESALPLLLTSTDQLLGRLCVPAAAKVQQYSWVEVMPCDGHRNETMRLLVSEPLGHSVDQPVADLDVES